MWSIFPKMALPDSVFKILHVGWNLPQDACLVFIEIYIWGLWTVLDIYNISMNNHLKQNYTKKILQGFFSFKNYSLGK
jgi:hypothetical protein